MTASPSVRLAGLAGSTLALFLLVLGSCRAPQGKGPGPGAPAPVDGPRRLLLLDAEWSHPDLHAPFIHACLEAGWIVEYRRDYPHLTRQDLSRYCGACLLAGRRPVVPSDRFTPADIRAAVELVRNGGLLILGAFTGAPTDAIGDDDRKVFNSIALGVGSRTRIADDTVLNQSLDYASVVGRVPLQWRVGPDGRVGEPIAAGFAPPLSVSFPDRVLLASGPSSFLATEGSRVRRAERPSGPSEGVDDRHGGAPAGDQSTGEARGYATMALSTCGRGVLLVGSRLVLDGAVGPSGISQGALVGRGRLAGGEGMLGALLHGLSCAEAGCAEASISARPWQTSIAPGPRPQEVAWSFSEIPEAPPSTPLTVFVRHVETGPCGRVCHSPAPAPPSDLYLPGDIQHNPLRCGLLQANEFGEDIEPVLQMAVSSGLNCVWGNFQPQMLDMPGTTEDQRLLFETEVSIIDSAMVDSGGVWLAGFDLDDPLAMWQNLPASDGAGGILSDFPPPTSLDVWRRSAILPLTRLAKASLGHPNCIGIIVGLRLRNRRTPVVSEGCDASFATLQRILPRCQTRGPGGAKLFPSMPVAQDSLGEFAASAGWWRGLMDPEVDRAQWLESHSLWEPCLAELELEAEALGRELRESMDRINPNLVLGFHASGVMPQWFYRGLWRGAGSPHHPILLIVPGDSAGGVQETLRQDGICAMTLPGLYFSQCSAGETSDFISEHGQSGFWLGNLTGLVMPSKLTGEGLPRDGEAAEYWRSVTEAIRQASGGK